MTIFTSLTTAMRRHTNRDGPKQIMKGGGNKTEASAFDTVAPRATATVSKRIRKQS